MYLEVHAEGVFFVIQIYFSVLRGLCEDERLRRGYRGPERSNASSVFKIFQLSGSETCDSDFIIMFHSEL